VWRVCPREQNARECRPRPRLQGVGDVVTERTEVPSGTLAVGSPAAVKTELDDPDTGAAAAHYRELSTRYAESSDRLDG